MAVKYVDKLHECSNYKYKLWPDSKCKRDAYWDASGPGGHWGYWCNNCYENSCSSLGSTEFKLREPTSKPISEIKEAKEPTFSNMDYWENAMVEGVREVICPYCDKITRLELDASGKRKCHNCLQQFTIPMSPI
jgi:hypothetical protein